jgi:hypothetical protein
LKLRITTFIAALYVVPAIATAQPTLDALVERHALARGGTDSIEAVQGITLALKIVEPSFELDGRYSATRSGCMRIDAFMDGQHAVSEGVANGIGWAIDGGSAATRPQPEGGEAILLHGIENPTRLIGLHEFRGRGHSLSYHGQITLDSGIFHKLTATYADGYSAEIFLDPETHLIARMREHKPMHFEVDPAKLHIETRFSDFRTVAGVVFPFRSDEVNWQTGEKLGTTIVKSLAVNSPAAARACETPTAPVTFDLLPDTDHGRESGSSPETSPRGAGNSTGSGAL